MHRALALADTVRGRTSPNPAVGAVILAANETLVGEGARAGRRPARRDPGAHPAGERARGATAVVTLEPCAHTGRTGPCTDALIAAGIGRVVYAVDDPNPDAAGGARALRAAGVDVVAGRRGPTRPSAARCGRGCMPCTSAGRSSPGRSRAPSTDGLRRPTRPRGGSPAPSRADAHALRAIVDAIVVGSGTVLADDPALTVRDDDDVPADHQPLRVVLDRRHRVRAHAQVLDNVAETLVLDTAVPPRLRPQGAARPGRPPCAARRWPDPRRGIRRGALCRRGHRVHRSHLARVPGPVCTGGCGNCHLGRGSHTGRRHGHPDRARREDRRPPALAGRGVAGVHRDHRGARRSRRLEPHERLRRCCVVRSAVVGEDAPHGASIAVNGVCLTVVGWRRERPGRAGLRRHGRDPQAQRDRHAGAGGAGEPRARGAGVRAAGRPHRAGPCRRHRGDPRPPPR